MSNVCMRCDCCQCDLNLVLSAIAKCVGLDSTCLPCCTTVIVAVETHCQDREASACAFLSCAWCFSSQCIGFHHMWCTSPNHYIGIVCIIFWHAVQTCLWCTYPVWPRHTIHMRCGSWASIACNQSPVQGLWVVIADGERRVPVHPCHVLDIFETLYRLPSHVMYFSQSLYWCCLHHILTCSACMIVVHISSLTMHTIHMRCGSWASIACNQSPAQGLWVVITDGITYSPESTQLQW